MNETVQQYVRRILGNVEGQDPLKVLAGTPRKLERLAAKGSASKLRKRPAPDKWSVAEILAHLADGEIITSWRVRAILGSPGTPIQAYDQNAWVKAGHYEKRNPRESIKQMRVLREANLALFRTLSPEQWKQYGIHAERGQESIEQIVRMLAGHDLNHLHQIENILVPKSL